MSGCRCRGWKVCAEVNTEIICFSVFITDLSVCNMHAIQCFDFWEAHVFSLVGET